MHIPWHTLTLLFLIVTVAAQSVAIFFLARQLQALAIVLRAVAGVQLGMWRSRLW